MTHLLLPAFIVACVTFAIPVEPGAAGPQSPTRAPLVHPVAAGMAGSMGGTGGCCLIAIDGTKQGAFKSEVAQKGVERIAGLRVGYEVTVTRDPATGLSSGKRQHRPLTFVKELGAASPQILNACVSNETLKTVTLDFLSAPPSGDGTVYFTIKLTNASVSDIKYMTEDGKQLEEVSLTFQKIEVSSVAGKTTAADDCFAKG